MTKLGVKFDTETVSYYSYVGEYWIGFDDVHSIKGPVCSGLGPGWIFILGFGTR